MQNALRSVVSAAILASAPVVFRECSERAAAEPVTLESLLAEMTDLDRLARPPEPGTKLVQFSSYDRASKSSADPAGWFANGDAGNYLRVERMDGEDWSVLADAEGPGAIVRIWSANPAGTVRIWLDGAREPAIDAPFADLLTGKVEPFGEPLAGERSRGCNLYFPIPFARRCLVATSMGGQFFHVDVRRFAPGTEVETLTRPGLAAASAAILQARERLRTLPGRLLGEWEATIDLAEGGYTTFEGAGVVEDIELTLSGAASEEALRNHTLSVWWDGEQEPSVWAPLGDFFATAPGLTTYGSLPVRVSDEGRVAVCRFPMPFARSARIEVVRESSEPLQGRLRITARHDKSAADRLRFHAWWRGAPKLPTRPMCDWTVLAGEGEGRLVGVALFVANPVAAWWGEGDEKVFVDGEAFPSIFGTGTEDYFGYAWCDPALFEHAYHGQSRCDGPGNRGYTAVRRFHILDDIPFHEKIRFDLEVWHWAQVEMGYATLAYWYARPGFRHSFEPATAKDRAIPEIPPMRRVEGALEGEILRVLEATSGNAGPQDMEAFGDGWSGGAHLWWRDAGPGDRLRLAFESEGEGKKMLVLALTRAPDYGIVRVALDGEALGDPIDLYAPRVEPAEPIELEVRLSRGTHELAVTIEGSNPAASPKNHMFGLDYLLLRPPP
ncbi:MAG: DUF2961 domain-containing protein [Planctomycetes bacterium]|nr:DUF2961 domain-containing protein [Planctomycetota bacterium]